MKEKPRSQLPVDGAQARLSSQDSSSAAGWRLKREQPKLSSHGYIWRLLPKTLNEMGKRSRSMAYRSHIRKTVQVRKATLQKQALREARLGYS